MVGTHAWVRWHATAAWSQGMHPRAEQELAARHDASGLLDVDLSDGSVRAATSSPALAPALAAGATADGAFVLEPDGDRWRLVDAATHRPIATLTLPSDFHEPTVIEGRLYLRHDPEGIEAIELSSGRVRWRRLLPRPPRFAAPQ